MRHRLLAFALAATAAAGMLTPAQAAPGPQFDRACSGKVVDTMCYSDFCGIADCIRRDCLVYSGVLGGGNTAVCVGEARPRDPWEA